MSLGHRSQMHRLILVSILVCANFCCYRDTFATPQSASIKALRNANLRRDGKHSFDLCSSLERSHLLLSRFFGSFTPPPNTREHAIPNEPTTKMLFVRTQLSMAINSVGPGAAFYREGAFHGAQCVSLNCPEWLQQSAGHRDLSAHAL